MRIEARGLVVRFGGRAALAGLDCDLVSGELVGLIGPNGAGKTTLLRVLAGLQRPDAGEARYDGLSAGELGRATLARRVAYLAQSGLSHWPLSVAHVVALGRLPHQRPFSPPSAADRAAVAVTGAIGFVGLVAPHLLRPLVGNRPGRLLLVSGLGGAIVLLAADVAVRLIPVHPELKLGVATALIGAPLLYGLIDRMRREA